jgi:energy-coupling factor transporter ATP-binding protein EcfA2
MEKIIIKNFGPIEDAEIEIRKVLVLIGEQASGKSTIAKLVFFFKTIGEEVFDRLNASTSIDPARMSSFLLSAYKAYFSRLFTAVAAQSDYEIEYVYRSGIKVRLIPTEFNGPVVSFVNPDLATMMFDNGEIRIQGEELRSNLDRYKAESTEVGVGNIERSVEIRDLIIHKLKRLRTLLHAVLGGEFSTRIFHPAVREVSVTRSSQGELPGSYPSSDDTLMMRFENFRLAWNEYFSHTPLDFYEARISIVPEFEATLTRMRKILKGTIGSDGQGKPYIQLEKVNKRVYLPDASSGQKSSYPVLQDVFSSWLISEFQNASDDLLKSKFDVFRVIEEPEAHLFPTAQKQLIELLVFLANAQPESQVIITTHSPYVLTSVNNMLMAYHAAASSPASEAEISELYPPKFRIAPDDLATYSLGNTAFEPEEGDEPEPFCVDILARDTGMIAQNYLDTVSEWLGYEFHFLMGIYRKANPRRAAQ